METDDNELVISHNNREAKVSSVSVAKSDIETASTGPVLEEKQIATVQEVEEKKNIDYPLPSPSVSEMTPPVPPETREEDIKEEEDDEQAEEEQKQDDINIIDASVNNQDTKGDNNNLSLGNHDELSAITDVGTTDEQSSVVGGTSMPVEQADNGILGEDSV